MSRTGRTPGPAVAGGLSGTADAPRSGSAARWPAQVVARHRAKIRDRALVFPPRKPPGGLARLPKESAIPAACRVANHRCGGHRSERRRTCRNVRTRSRRAWLARNAPMHRFLYREPASMQISDRRLKAWSCEISRSACYNLSWAGSGCLWSARAGLVSDKRPLGAGS